MFEDLSRDNDLSHYRDILSQYIFFYVPKMVHIAILNFHSPGVTHITIPTRISPCRVPAMLLKLHLNWRFVTCVVAVSCVDSVT